MSVVKDVPAKPVSGRLSSSVFEELTKTLVTYLQEQSVKLDFEETLRELVEQQARLARVTSKATGKSYLNQSTRLGQRITFGATLVSKLTNLLQPIMGSAKPEPSHGDLLYYTEGGHFDPHRDTLGHCPYPGRHRCLTMLICLGAETGAQSGGTMIYEPEQSYYLATVTPSYYLTFPADLLHSGTKLVGSDSFKLCLKLDWWLPLGEGEEESMADLPWDDTDECNGYDEDY